MPLNRETKPNQTNLSPGYTIVTCVQGTNRKFHTAKMVESTYSSQVWNVKKEGSYVLAAEKRNMSAQLSPVHRRGGFPGLLCHDQKGLVTLESSLNTVTRETTLFSLPTYI